MLSDLEALTLQVETLFVHDVAGRLRYVNEPDSPPAPRFFLGQTSEGNLCRFRHDLPETLVEALTLLAHSEPVSKHVQTPPLHAETYQDVLAKHGTVQQMWSGPAYYFPEAVRWPPCVVSITEANADLLDSDFAWLKAVLAAKQPCVAVVVENRAVSVCHSSRTSRRAAEAGLETLLAFRGRGYAAAAVRGWAAAARDAGRIPLYSTSWRNAASQGVAAKLGLRLYANDFHLT